MGVAPEIVISFIKGDTMFFLKQMGGRDTGYAAADDGNLEISIMCIHVAPVDGDGIRKGGNTP